MKRIRSKYANPDFQFVRFSLSGREFGLEVSSVKEIMRYMPPEPGECPPFAEGLVRIRSMRVPVIDLRKRFGLPPIDLKTSRIIVSSIDSIIAGLIVDGISDITLGVKEFILKPDGEGAPWDHLVEARVEAHGASVLVLSACDILTPAEKEALCTPVAGGLGLNKPGQIC